VEHLCDLNNIQYTVLHTSHYNSSAIHNVFQKTGTSSWYP